MVIIWILFSSNCQRLQCYDNVPYHRWTSVQISRASLNLFTCSRIPPLFKIPLLSEPWRYFRVAITDVTLHIFQQIYIYIEISIREDWEMETKEMDIIFYSNEKSYLQLHKIAYLLQLHYTRNGFPRFSRVSAVSLARVFHYLILFCQALCHFNATFHELRWIYIQTSDHKVYERNKRWCISCLALKVAELILKKYHSKLLYWTVLIFGSVEKKIFHTLLHGNYYISR